MGVSLWTNDILTATSTLVVDPRQERAIGCGWRVLLIHAAVHYGVLRNAICAFAPRSPISLSLPSVGLIEDSQDTFRTVGRGEVASAKPALFIVTVNPGDSSTRLGECGSLMRACLARQLGRDYHRPT